MPIEAFSRSRIPVVFNDNKVGCIEKSDDGSMTYTDILALRKRDFVNGSPWKSGKGWQSGKGYLLFQGSRDNCLNGIFFQTSFEYPGVSHVCEVESQRGTFEEKMQRAWDSAQFINDNCLYELNYNDMSEHGCKILIPIINPYIACAREKAREAVITSKDEYAILSGDLFGTGGKLIFPEHKVIYSGKFRSPNHASIDIIGTRAIMRLYAKMKEDECLGFRITEDQAYYEILAAKWDGGVEVRQIDKVPVNVAELLFMDIERLPYFKIVNDKFWGISKDSYDCFITEMPASKDLLNPMFDWVSNDKIDIFKWDERTREMAKAFQGKNEELVVTTD